MKSVSLTAALLATALAAAGLRAVARPDPGRRLLDRAALRLDRRRGLRRELRLPDPGGRLRRLLGRPAAVLRRRRPRHHRHRQLLAADPRERGQDLRRQRRDRHHRGPDRLRRHRLRLEDRRARPSPPSPRPSGTRRSPPRWSKDGALVAEPEQDLGPGRPEPARRPDPRLRPRHQARHPRGLRGEGDPAGLRGQRARSRRSPRINGGDEDAAHDACVKLRTDGAAVDIDGDYTETLARIESDPNGIGVFGLAFYENNTNVLKVATMGGVTPSTETIASGEYPVSRPLFFYLKKAHIGEVAGPQGVRRVLRLRRRRRPRWPARDLRPRLRPGARRDPGAARRRRDPRRGDVIAVPAPPPRRRRRPSSRR